MRATLALAMAALVGVAFAGCTTGEEPAGDGNGACPDINATSMNASEYNATYPNCPLDMNMSGNTTI